MKMKIENMEEKKFQSALFRPLGWWTGNNFLFKAGLMCAYSSQILIRSL